jgi:hypothetical protein
MLSLPREAKVLELFRPAFSAPTYQRFLVLCLGAIVTMGRRSVSRILWSVRCLMSGHPSSYHRVFSAACWSLWPLAKVLAAMVVELVPKDQPVIAILDDTVDQHRGDHVFGKGCHRDAVRSSWSRTVFKFGHKWVVLAVSVRLPLCKRSWALPVLAALYVLPPKEEQEADPTEATQDKAGKQSSGKKQKSSKDRKSSKQQKSSKKQKPCKKQKLSSELRQRDESGKLPPRHKTPALLGRQMIATLMHWCPDRKFILLGDWGFSSHELALFCHRHRRRVSLIGRTRSDMNLHALAPARRPGRRGSPPRKGAKLPTPAQAVASAVNRRHATVRWYGNGVRDLEILCGCGGWYRHRGSGRAALIPVRWVYVHDPKTGREDYFYSTHLSFSPEQIIEGFSGRWPIEVTFEEIRAHLGFETTRHWCENSVLRVAPCLLGLFSLVSLIYAELAGQKKVSIHATPCYHKTDPTFADALASVRRLLWEQVILQHAPGGRHVANLPTPIREILLEHITAAA